MVLVSFSTGFECFGLVQMKNAAVDSTGLLSIPSMRTVNLQPNIIYKIVSIFFLLLIVNINIPMQFRGPTPNGI